MGKSDKAFGPKEYFSLIAEMLYCVDPDYCLTKDSVRLYIKAKYNHDCDDKKLTKALSKFDSSLDTNGETWYDLKSKQYSKFVGKKWVVRSSVKMDEILDLGFKPLKDKMKADLAEKMDKPTCTNSKKFEEYRSIYLNTIQPQFSNRYKTAKFPHYELSHRAIAELMTERLLDNNAKAIQIVNCEVFKEIIPFSDDSGCKSYQRICAFALRVLAYKKHLDSGNNPEEYKSITIEDCLEIAKNHEIFKPHRDAAEEYDKPSYIDSLAENMFTSAFKVRNGSRNRVLKWEDLLWRNQLATDKACYELYKYILEKCQSANKDVIDVKLDDVVYWVLRYFEKHEIAINDYDYSPRTPLYDDIPDTSDITDDTDNDDYC